MKYRKIKYLYKFDSWEIVKITDYLKCNDNETKEDYICNLTAIEKDDEPEILILKDKKICKFNYYVGEFSNKIMNKLNKTLRRLFYKQKKFENYVCDICILK